MLQLLDDLRQQPLKAAWSRLASLPGGRLLFSKAVGRMAPYTGTIGATVVELGPGYAKTELRDRKAIRQHLGSVHAIALANLGELTTGLAVLYDFPADARGIVTSLSVEYTKKARGLLTAECTVDPVASSEQQTLTPVARIRDESGDVVAVVTAHWLVRPRG